MSHVEPIHLDMLDGITKIRQAHAEGRLLAQVDPGSNGQYRGKNNAPCAIGVMLPDDVARVFDSGKLGYVSIGSLTGNGHVKWPNDVHAEWASEIQTCHDVWLGESPWPSRSAERLKLEARFLAALDKAETILKKVTP